MMTFGAQAPCQLIGMVHALALPGSGGWKGSMERVIEQAIEDAKRLKAGGCDGIIVENMHDAPYLKGAVYPETAAAMAVVVAEVVGMGLPTGVQVLAGANRQALGVAVAAGAHFIRCEGFAYGHIADEGWIEATAGELVRARAAMNADVQFFADIQKKHASHAMTADLSLAEVAKGHVFCGADGLIVTGVATGQPTAPDDIEAAKGAGLPVLVGSGVTVESAPVLSSIADGLIVGSWLKEDGDWRRPVDERRVRALREAIRQ